jgi:hypothetical protein
MESGTNDKCSKIYRAEPITIKGIRIGHTKEGLQFMIDHQTKILTEHKAKLSINDQDHIAKQIINYRQHLELYRIQEEETHNQNSK